MVFSVFYDGFKHFGEETRCLWVGDIIVNLRLSAKARGGKSLSVSMDEKNINLKWVATPVEYVPGWSSDECKIEKKSLRSNCLCRWVPIKASSDATRF